MVPTSGRASCQQSPIEMRNSHEARPSEFTKTEVYVLAAVLRVILLRQDSFILWEFAFRLTNCVQSSQ